MADPTGTLEPRPGDSNNMLLRKILLNLADLPGTFITPAEGDARYVKLDGTSSIMGTVSGQSGFIGALIGGDASAIGRTDATDKFGRYAAPHYTNAEEPLGLILGYSSAAGGRVDIGGGSSFVNAATSVNFYTAANNTTTTGTRRGGFNSVGLFDVVGVSQFGGAVTLPSTNTAGIQLYNTTDQTTNYERLEFLWTGNVAQIRTRNDGTGQKRALSLGRTSEQSLTFNADFTLGQHQFRGTPSSTANSIFASFDTYTNTATSGANIGLSLTPTYNQASGTAANTDLDVNRTETAIGSGTQRLLALRVGGAEKLGVNNLGDLMMTAKTAVAETPSATHTLRGFRDSTGTEYKVLCVAV